MNARAGCYLVGAIVALFLLCTLSVAFAQDDPPAAADALGLQITDRTVKLPLDSVLVLALKRNLDITFARLQPEISATEITREKAAFDTLFTSQLSKHWQREQVGNSLMGSRASPDIYQEQTDWEAKLQKKFTTGTVAELRALHQEYQTDLPFQGLNPQYSGDVSLSLTQPLLRDFGITIGTSMIRIASLNFEISEYDFRKNVMDILYQVETFYWDLYYRIADLDAKQRSLKSAKDLLREFKIRIEAGTLAPIEIYQAEAEVALRRQDVIVAEHFVAQAEDNLKASLNLYDQETLWDLNILPADEPVVDKTVPNVTECIQVAFEHRPDFLAARLNLQAADIEIKYTKNQRLPRIDLIGSIGTTGLAGRPQDTSGAFGPFYRAQLSPWDGHWDDVYDGVFDDDFYYYTVGVKLEFPLENRLAKSQHSRARVQRLQALTSIKNIENTIINEVRDAVRAVITTQKVYDSARASLKLSTEKLNAEEKKFRVGMSTTHDLLEFQEELAAAESTLAEARTRHQQALADLARVKGVLLEDKGLTL